MSMTSVCRFASKVCVLLMLGSTAGSALALSKFSRACRFADIPRPLQSTALDFFSVISTAPSGKFNYLWNGTAAQRESAFIIESLTTDYGEVRYNLYAENQVYEARFDSRDTFIGFEYVRSMSSGGWTAEKVPDDVAKNSRFEIFFQNRGLLYSARAGNSEIIEQFPLADPLRFWKFKVIGYHAYFNFNGNQTVTLGKSESTNCNLTEWGFEQR